MDLRAEPLVITLPPIEKQRSGLERLRLLDGFGVDCPGETTDPPD
jgi:hypothetical protein